jgi:hypothetical protein
MCSRTPVATAHIWNGSAASVVGTAGSLAPRCEAWLRAVEDAAPDAMALSDPGRLAVAASEYNASST